MQYKCDILNLPKSVFLFLPQIKISLDHFPNMLGFFICELGQIQRLPCNGARHRKDSAASGLQGTNRQERVVKNFLCALTKPLKTDLRDKNIQ